MLIFLIDTFLLKNRLLFFILDPIKKFKRQIFVIFFSVFLLAGVVVLLNTYGVSKMYDFETLLSSPKGGDKDTFSFSRSISGVLTGIYVLIFELSPVVLASFLFGIFSSLKKEFLEKKSTLAIFYLLVFILLYYLGSSVSYIESTVRYQISIYPIAGIIAAVGLYRFINIEKLNKIFLQKTFLICLIFIAILTASLISIKPFYFSYASGLLPKNQILNSKDMGDGSYEASAYLNSLPDAKNLTIWADKVAVCELFAGKCHVYLQPEIIDDPEIDYFVVSKGRTDKSVYFAAGRLSKEKAAYFKKLYSPESSSDFKIEIGGKPKNFVKVIKSEKANGN